MKKYSFIAIVVLLASLTAACTYKELLPADSLGNDAWAYDETLPVPIEFGSDQNAFSIDTKGVELASLAGFNYHVLAMDLTKVQDFANYTNIKTLTSSTDANDVFLLKDVPATITNKAVGDASGPAGNYAQFLDAEGGNPITYYYPQVTDPDKRLNYSFVAYSVPNRTSNGAGYNLTVRDDEAPYNKTAFVDFKLVPSRMNDGIDCNVDVVWGIAIEDNPYTISGVQYRGYNAQYIRKARANDPVGFADGDYLPQMTLTHTLSAIQIRIVADTSEPGVFLKDASTGLGIDVSDPALYGTTYASKVNYVPVMSVKNLQVKTYWSNARMNLRTGEVTPVGTDAHTAGNQWNDIWTGVADYEVPVDPRLVDGTENVYGYTGAGNYFIYVIPGARTDGTSSTADQRIQVQFDIDGLEGAASEPVALKLPVMDSGDKGYDAGKKYVYTIKVSPKQAEGFLITTLDPWTDGNPDFENADDSIIGSYQ